jgi:SAM-dependent methyltransferase
VDIRAYNRAAWDRKVAQGDRWTIPVSAEVIERARAGDWSVLLTPTRPVPREWFPDLHGADVLCLASGGGQQGPILAAAGAKVTVLDNSPAQLQQDRVVAQREGVDLTTVEGDMADLSPFDKESFDLVFHPCANCFVPEVRPVWRESARVLRSGGSLLAGFANPLRYLFDDERMENGNLEVRHALPYSDLTNLTDEERHKAVEERGLPLEFGHTLEDQIGGQLHAGLLLCGFYEDRFEDAVDDPISKYAATFIATWAIRP